MPRTRAFLLPLLALAACAAPDEGADPSLALQDALAQHRASIAGLEAEAPRPRVPGARTEGAEPPMPLRASQAAGPNPTLAGQLVGQGPEAVTAFLGEPRLRREEGEAEIWHYSAAHCHLDLVLYREGEALRVAFAAARAIGTTRRGETACLRDIARGAGATRAAPETGRS